MTNKSENIILEKKEYEIIKELIAPIKDSPNLLNKCIARLKREMEKAIILENENFPEDTIRINSIVDIQTPYGDMKLQLVLPEHTNSAQKKISLLTPMGSGLIGYSVGDEILWHFPQGEQIIKITKVTASEFA
jgi:regulator of nucleoside diphosphate kinase